MSSTLICALSGQTSISDPVALPTGQICSKSLLLKKLIETANTNPFQPDSDLDESQLIELKTTNDILPPRPATNSIPSLLNALSSEYDAIVLELFDTRKALENTRKELSHALYQNDAAVRVIARVCIERDMARKKISKLSEKILESTESEGNIRSKRKRTDGSGDVNVVPEDERDNTLRPGSAIPREMKEKLEKMWIEMSSARKMKTKASANYPTISDFSSYTQKVKSYHETNAKGITALAGNLMTSSTVISSSKDGQIVYFNAVENKVEKKLELKSVLLSSNLISSVRGSMAMIGSDDILSVSFGSGSIIHDLDIQINNVIGVELHPSAELVFVAQKDGSIHLFEINREDQTLNYVALWSVGAGCTCIGLHPDGLILGVGKEDGSLGLWDLKAERMAVTLFDKCIDSPIRTVAFSEKGVHVATAHQKGSINLWDLRKQKSLRIIESNASVGCLAFCPVGKYLAYGNDSGEVVVTTVKDFESKANIIDEGKITGLIWGFDAKSLIIANDSSRQVKFWEASETK